MFYVTLDNNKNLGFHSLSNIADVKSNLKTLLTDAMKGDIHLKQTSSITTTAMKKKIYKKNKLLLLMETQLHTSNCNVNTST